MKQIEVFDPAMCCSTGVCGPSVDPALARFAADLAWLTRQGAVVRRFNLAQEPGAFAEREPVARALRERGEASLPLVLAAGRIAHEGEYPSRAQLAEMVGLEEPAVSSSPVSSAEGKALPVISTDRAGCSDTEREGGSGSCCG